VATAEKPFAMEAPPGWFIGRLYQHRSRTARRRLTGRVAEARRCASPDWRKLTRTCLVKRLLDQKSGLAILNFVRER
jgi:hypothetical protein